MLPRNMEVFFFQMVNLKDETSLKKKGQHHSFDRGCCGEVSQLEGPESDYIFGVEVIGTKPVTPPYLPLKPNLQVLVNTVISSVPKLGNVSAWSLRSVFGILVFEKPGIFWKTQVSMDF